MSPLWKGAGAQTGSYTFDFGETHKAPAGLKLEISAQTVQGDVYSETFTFEGGQSEETARDLSFHPCKTAAGQLPRVERTGSL